MQQLIYTVMLLVGRAVKLTSQVSQFYRFRPLYLLNLRNKEVISKLQIQSYKYKDEFRYLFEFMAEFYLRTNSQSASFKCPIIFKHSDIYSKFNFV